jgi:HlyD family secretion protein
MIAIAALVIIAGGLALWRMGESRPADQELTLFGNVEIRDVQVAFAVSGRIQSILADEGDRVVKGQLLAELDDRRFVEAVDVRAAELATQQQVLLALEHGSRVEDIDQARGEVAALAAELEVAARHYERELDLRGRDAVSQQTVDDAKAARDAAEGHLLAARANLARLLAGPRAEDISGAQAGLAAAEAALARAQTDLEDTKLVAPSVGIIQNRLLEPGDMAGPQKPVFSLALINPIWVRAYLPEPDLGKIREGMPASITTDSFPDRSYAGWVGFISPTAEFTPKHVETTDLRTRLVYRIRVIACNSSGELRLGMPVTVKVKLDSPTNSEHPRCEPD